jgi:hypothetical protein
MKFINADNLHRKSGFRRLLLYWVALIAMPTPERFRTWGRTLRSRNHHVSLTVVFCKTDLHGAVGRINLLQSWLGSCKQIEITVLLPIVAAAVARRRTFEGYGRQKRQLFRAHS